MLLSVSTGKESSLRVFVWRQLRKLGAVYIHQSVCLLPDRAEVRATLRPVVSRVRSQGGHVRLLSIRVAGEEHEALVQEQQQAATSSTPKLSNGHPNYSPSWPSKRLGDE